jgi:hypothetical protein
LPCDSGQADSGTNAKLLKVLGRLKTENLGHDTHQGTYLKNNMYNNPEDENEKLMYSLTEGIGSIAYRVDGTWSHDDPGPSQFK